MDIIGPFFQEIVAIAGYAMVFAGVYKIYQMATDLREIKEAVLRHSQHSASSFPGIATKVAIATSVPGVSADRSLDDAESYAETLLRAVNAESRPAPEAVENSAPRQ